MNLVRSKLLRRRAPSREHRVSLARWSQLLAFSPRRWGHLGPGLGHGSAQGARGLGPLAPRARSALPFAPRDRRIVHPPGVFGHFCAVAKRETVNIEIRLRLLQVSLPEWLRG